MKLQLWGTRSPVSLSVTLTSGPLLWGSGTGLWSSEILSYLLSLPRRRLRRIRLWTRAATNHPLRTGTGAVEICSPSQTGSGESGAGHDQDRRPKARGHGGIVNPWSPGNSTAWGMLLGTPAVQGAQRGMGTRAATHLARTWGNKARDQV